MLLTPVFLLSKGKQKAAISWYNGVCIDNKAESLKVMFCYFYYSATEFSVAFIEGSLDILTKLEKTDDVVRLGSCYSLVL